MANENQVAAGLQSPLWKGFNSLSVYAILDGENPIKVWREYRGMSQPETAEKAGISVPYLSQLETNKRKGSLNVLSAIAKALQVSLENIVSSQS